MAGEIVKLTGKKWNGYFESYRVATGDVYEIERVTNTGLVKFKDRSGNWSVMGGFEIEKVGGSVKPEISSEPVVKYAAQLSALDIGAKKSIAWIKQYRYANEDREKMVVIYHPYTLSYAPRTNPNAVSVRGYKKLNQRYEYEQWEIPVGVEVVISDIS